MADFDIEIAAFVERAGAQATEFFRAFAEDLKSRVQELTPVVTGRLRAGWFVEPADYVELGGTLTIGNNVEYARRVEYGFVGEDSLGRHYHQLGRGMVAQTIAEAPAIAEATLRRLTT